MLLHAAVMGLSQWVGGAQECAAGLAEGLRDGRYVQYVPATHWLLVIAVLVILLLPLLLNIWGWALWIVLSIILGLSRTFFSIFTVLHVLVDVWGISTLKTCYTGYRFLRRLCLPEAAASTRQRLLDCKTLKEYKALAKQIDAEDGALDWRADDETDLPQSATLKSTIAKLDECLQAKDTSKLQFLLLNGLLKRNHLGIDERVSWDDIGGAGLAVALGAYMGGAACGHAVWPVVACV